MASVSDTAISKAELQRLIDGKRAYDFHRSNR